jgi:glutathione S-transferase
MSELKLYGANVCPFVHRTRLVLAEKGLSYEYVAVDLRNKPDWYYDVLPTGKVPLLLHQEQQIWESDIICHYLEEAFPTPALLPSDPLGRARARLWVSWASDTLIPLYYQLLRGQDTEEREAVKERLTAALARLDKALQEGPWLLGEQLSLADLELYPWFERWGVLEHYRDYPLPEQLGRLVAWRARLAARPSAVAIAETPEFFIEQYETYARPPQT